MNIKDELQNLLVEDKNAVVFMGNLVENALNHSIEALKSRDLSLAHQIIADDAQIDEKRYDIEKKTLQLIATYRPEVADLNTFAAILNIITELERMGDYATGIAKIVIMIGDEPPLKPLIDIPRMAEITVDMLHNSLKSFMENDSQAATRVIGMDVIVDNLYDQIFRELLTFMMTDPKTINRATRLIWVAHNIERAADRATNICERVIFMVTGNIGQTEATNY
jgi:phosphate transport system protein